MVFVSLALAVSPALSRPKQVLYFPPTVTGPVLSQSVLESVRQRFENVLGSYGIYKVVADDDAVERIGRADVGEFRACREASCRVRMSRLAGADISASLSISGRRGSCLVEGVLSPAWSDRGDIKARFESGCDVVELVEAVGVVAAMLCGKDPRAAVPPRQPAVAPPPALAPAPANQLTPATVPQAVPATAASSVVTPPRAPQPLRAENLVHKTGFLTIETTPSNADIEIDGKIVGKSPFQAEVEVGKRRIRVTLDKFFHDKSVEVNLGPDGRRIDLQLAPAFGSLEITSDVPGSLVTIDGRRAGTTPFVIDRALSGTYVVEVSNPSRRPSRRQVVVSDGRRTTEAFQLEKLVGVLSVLTRNQDGDPCTGRLSIDGRPVGTTPFKATVVSGRHILEASCEGGSTTSVVDVPVDLRLSIVLRMPPRVVPAAAAKSAREAGVAHDQQGKPVKTEMPDKSEKAVQQEKPVKPEGAVQPAVQAAVSPPDVQADPEGEMLVEDDAAPVVSKPVHKKWWFWTIIGVAAAGVAGGVAAGVLLNGGGAPSSGSGIMTH